MNKILLGLFCVTAGFTTYADIYKWVDSDGNVHFGDTPHAGAEKLKLPDAQSYSSPNVPTSNVPSSANSSSESKVSKHAYRNVLIAQPDNETTIRNNRGAILTSVQLEPALFEGDKIQLIFDGSPLGPPQTNSVFQLNNVFRGSHTIAAQIIDVEGQVLITSDPITVYVQRPRVGMAVPIKAR